MNAYYENTGYRSNTGRERAIPSHGFGDGLISIVGSNRNKIHIATDYPAIINN